jgi:long-chain acyl-CoA synthetase
MDVSIVFCDDQEQVDKLVEIRDRIPNVKKVLYEDPRGMRDYRSDDWFMFIDDLYALGETARTENPERFDQLIDAGHPDDVCHFCLTSGTTGLPKGAMLTHINYINMGLQLTEVDHLEADDEYVSCLDRGADEFLRCGPGHRNYHQFSGVGRDRHGGFKRDRPAFYVRCSADI